MITRVWAMGRGPNVLVAWTEKRMVSVVLLALGWLTDGSERPQPEA